ALVHAFDALDQGAVFAKAAQSEGPQPLGQSRIDQRGLAFVEGDAGVAVQDLGDVAEVLGGEDELALDQRRSPGGGGHAASASLSGTIRSSSIRLIIRPSMAKMPLTKFFT